MVSINSRINNPGTINTSQVHIKTRNDNANGLKKQPDTDFSALLEKKQATAPVTPKKTEVPQESLSSYSPLMLRYGSNRITEIKDIAKDYGIEDLTNEDFDYAIRYGRSLLADYIV